MKSVISPDLNQAEKNIFAEDAQVGIITTTAKLTFNLYSWVLLFLPSSLLLFISSCLPLFFFSSLFYSPSPLQSLSPPPFLESLTDGEQADLCSGSSCADQINTLWIIWNNALWMHRSKTSEELKIQSRVYEGYIFLPTLFLFVIGIVLRVALAGGCIGSQWTMTSNTYAESIDGVDQFVYLAAKAHFR